MEKESKLYTVAKWLLAGAVAYVASFFVLGVVKGIVGIVAAAFIGTLAWNLWPLAQFGIKAFVTWAARGFARANPILTRETIEQNWAEELRLHREETTAIHGLTLSLKRKVLEAEERYPGNPDTVNLREQFEARVVEVEHRRETEGEAEKALAAHREETERLRLMYEAAMLNAKTAKRAGARKKDIEKLMLQSANAAIREAADLSFARLAASRIQAQQEKAALPPAQHRTAIPVVVADARLKEPARR